MTFMKPAAGTPDMQPKPKPEVRRHEIHRAPLITHERAQEEARQAAEVAQAEREKKEAADNEQLSALRDEMKRRFGREFSLEPQQERVDDYAVVKKEFFSRSGIFKIEIENAPQQTDSQARFSLTFRTKNPLTAEQLVADATAKIHEAIRFYRSFPKEEKAKAVALAVYTDVIKFLKSKHKNQLDLMPGEE